MLDFASIYIIIYCHELFLIFWILFPDLNEGIIKLYLGA